MKRNLFELMSEAGRQYEVAQILQCNRITQQFGIVLTQEDAAELVVYRKEALISERRVEFGESILPKIIETFCDSDYIQSDEAVACFGELQEVFFKFKNESQEQLTDDELLGFMRKQFEEVCHGSIEYLADTCLEGFVRAIRGGYVEWEED